jgi:hypothetical protein
MKNIKKLLNTNILATQMNSSVFFILETKFKKNSQKSVNSFSLSRHAFKNSSYFKSFKTLEFKFPLQLTLLERTSEYSPKNGDSSSLILLKNKHFVFTDKNLLLFSLKNEKSCINKLAFSLQSTARVFNNLLASAVVVK